MRVLQRLSEDWHCRAIAELPNDPDQAAPASGITLSLEGVHKVWEDRGAKIYPRIFVIPIADAHSLEETLANLLFEVVFHRHLHYTVRMVRRVYPRVTAKWLSKRVDTNRIGQWKPLRRHPGAI